MSIKTTSLLAFIGINNDGSATKLRGKVYNAIAANPNKNRKELSMITGISINSLCGRVHELLSCGAIYEHEPRRCTITGKLTAPLNIMVVGKQNLTQFERRPSIKVLEVRLKLATDALTEISKEWETAKEQQIMAVDALKKINKEK